MSTAPLSCSADARADLIATPWYRGQYALVLTGILVGALVGAFFPHVGEQLKPLGDVFIRLIRMMIEPIVFATVVVGVGSMGNVREVGRVGLKALVYFEVLSSIALVLGMIVANLLTPGSGIDLQSAPVSTAPLPHDSPPGGLGFISNLVPDSVVGAFARGDTLQVLFFSVLLGLGLSICGARAAPVIDLIERLSQGLFAVIGLIMRLAPVGAFGAMAFTIGKYGFGALHHLGFLLLAVYVTCLVFIFCVLAIVARLAGFSLWRFLIYIREELLIVLGTSTSESVLPRLMLKLENLGCAKPVVGMVVPTGYAFNLDGTAIYLSMAALFIGQAGHLSLSFEQQLGMLALLLLTSKGSAAVTGGGFVTLAATVSAMPDMPAAAGLALVFGVDRFMSEARALTNMIGNGVATVVIARWEGELDGDRMRRCLHPS